MISGSLKLIQATKSLNPYLCGSAIHWAPKNSAFDCCFTVILVSYNLSYRLLFSNFLSVAFINFLDISCMLNEVWPALSLSLKVAFWATALNLLLGVGVGFVLARTRFIGRDLLDTVLTLPMVMPPTVLGYYLLVLFGRHGVFGQWLQAYFGVSLIFTWQGAVVAAMVVTFPLVFKPARAAFEGVSPQLEQAARVLGLPEWAVFLRVTLPLAWRGILVGLLLAFARALGEFGATLMIAGSIPGKTQPLSIAVYEAVQAGNDVLATQLVVLISVVCVAVLWITNHFVRAKETT